METSDTAVVLPSEEVVVGAPSLVALVISTLPVVVDKSDCVVVRFATAAEVSARLLEVVASKLVNVL